MSWVGVDLDGTLAKYESYELYNPNVVGAPVPLMVERVKAWLKAGVDVRIVTARVAGYEGEARRRVEEPIRQWCLEHLGQILIVTSEKDMEMVELWDDRAVQVVKNTGIAIGTL